MADVLTEKELARISAAGTRKTMIDWLDECRIPYILARSGWPRVHVKAMEYALGVAPEAEDKGAGIVIDFG